MRKFMNKWYFWCVLLVVSALIWGATINLAGLAMVWDNLLFDDIVSWSMYKFLESWGLGFSSVSGLTDAGLLLGMSALFIGSSSAAMLMKLDV